MEKLKKIVIPALSLGGVASFSLIEFFNSLFENNNNGINLFDDIDLKTQLESSYFEGIKWHDTSKYQELKINSLDGITLSGELIENNNTNNYLILVHGLRSDKTHMYDIAKGFDALGYNLLLVDQRCCGKSQGKNITYGLKESTDLIEWINYLKDLKENVNICLYGISMGAATVNMALGSKLPSNVKCAISNASYTNLYDLFKYHVSTNYKLPYGPVLAMLSLFTKEKFGFILKEINPEKSLTYNIIPTLFINGDKDDVVPVRMSKDLYFATKGVKKYYPIENYGHFDTHFVSNYYNVIDSFIKSYIGD